MSAHKRVDPLLRTKFQVIVPGGILLIIITRVSDGFKDIFQQGIEIERIIRFVRKSEYNDDKIIGWQNKDHLSVMSIA